jgi:hypothetical protein
MAFQLDRTRFIRYYEDTIAFNKFIKKKVVVEDLVKGGEFVFTAQDFLDSLNTIPGCLVGVDGRVPAEECTLVYNQT